MASDTKKEKKTEKEIAFATITTYRCATEDAAQRTAVQWRSENATIRRLPSFIVSLVHWWDNAKEHNGNHLYICT